MAARWLKTLLFCALAASTAHAQDGATLYGAHCAMCHQEKATGIPENFPPLAGRIRQIGATASGQTYLEHVLLNGLQGAILVDGQRYDGVMPAMASLTDSEIAAILGYLSTLPDNTLATAFMPSDVASLRRHSLSPTELMIERQKILATPR